MPSYVTRIVICLAAMLAAVGITGCAGSPTRANPNIALLDGRWQLDRQASDDVRGRLLPLFLKNEEKWRRRAERFRFDEPVLSVEGDGPGRNAEVRDDGMSTLRWMQHERRKEIEVLIAMLSPATQIEIRRVDRSIRIATNKGEGARVVTPGESSSLFLAAGGFNVSSAWAQGGLLIESRGNGDNKLQIVERFTLAADGTRVEEQLVVKIPDIGKQSFHFVYKRG